jgi:hypothetical protein
VRAVAALLVALLAVSLGGCGGGGGGGSNGAGDLQAEATEVDRLLTRLEGLPESATTQQQFSRELRQIRDQVQVAVEEVQAADAPDELASDRDKLANRLRSLRTSLGRVQGLVDGGDLEAAQTAIPRLLLIAEIRSTIENIREGASASG